MSHSSELSSMRLANRTRRSDSIPRRLVAEGKYHLLPVYALLTTSDLAREGIRNSGSFRFADHIYRNEASGRFGVGRVLDRMLLGLRGARSMRSRFVHSRHEIRLAIEDAAHALRNANTSEALGYPEKDKLHRRQITVVSVPCGIARDLFDVAETMKVTDPASYERVRFVGIDLDPEPLALSYSLTRDHKSFRFTCADALQPGALPSNVDVIVSLGFGEFLSDGVLFDFYRRCHSALKPHGRFITSAMSRDRVADYLARELAELHTHYRSGEQLRSLLTSAGFVNTCTFNDDVGLQTLAVAEKGT